MPRLLRLVPLCAVLALGGCAPQLRLAAGPFTCAPMQRFALHRTQVMATLQTVQAVQARHSLSARYVSPDPEAWRAATARDCR